MEKPFDLGVGFKQRKSDKQNGKFIYFEKDKYLTFGDGDKEKKYEVQEFCDNIHWGQLKLFMSELSAFTYYLETSECSTIIYVGAAPGEHLYVLAKLFEELEFHLYDLAKFDKRLDELNNVKIYNKYFEEEDIKYWKNYPSKVFLISDIRNLTMETKEDESGKRESERIVWSDMKLQEQWVIDLEPYAALLKFRLPYAYDFILKEGLTRKYLDGTVFRQLYHQDNSSETRLLVKGIGYRDWNLLAYEQVNHYHNAITRCEVDFKNPIDNSDNPIYPEEGLKNKFDATAMTVVIYDYLKKINMTPSEENIKILIKYILNNITISGKNKLK